VGVAGHELSALTCRQGDQVGIVRILRSCGRRLNRIGRELGQTTEERDELICVLCWDPFAELRDRKRPLEFVQQALGHDELDIALEPPLEEARRRPTGGEETRDEDVYVEDESQRLGALAPRLVLCLDGQLHRFVLVERRMLPDAVE
jgi:hypothetical protein